MARERRHEQNVLALSDRIRDRRVPEVVQAHLRRQVRAIGVATKYARDHARVQGAPDRAHDAVPAALTLDRHEHGRVIARVGSAMSESVTRL